MENLPAGETVGVFGCSLELLGPRAVKFHFLLADGESAIQRALASLETLMPISARYMQSTKVGLTHRTNHNIVTFFSFPDSKCNLIWFHVIPGPTKIKILSGERGRVLHEQLSIAHQCQSNLQNPHIIQTISPLILGKNLASMVTDVSYLCKAQ